MTAVVSVEVITFVEIPGTARCWADALWMPMAAATAAMVAGIAYRPGIDAEIPPASKRNAATESA